MVSDAKQGMLSILLDSHYIYQPFSFCNDRLVQQRVEETDRIRKMKPEERLKLLKKTLKKSTRLTEKLLQRLDREWDDIYKEDSEQGMETSPSILIY